jgi:hypothetical protein
MSNDARDSNDPFVERTARVLRAPERFDDDFERSLVAAIRDDRPIERSEVRRRVLSVGWWNARSLRLSPAVGLALAASIAILAAAGTLRAAGVLAGSRVSATTAPSAITAAPVHDTVTYVRFVFVGQAKNVALVGDFNGWAKTPMHFTRAGSVGAWTTSVALPRGRHEYAFVVDGRTWVADPYAPTSSDEFDANSSVITVGD